jgi:virginiamycin B lyase
VGLVERESAVQGVSLMRAASRLMLLVAPALLASACSHGGSSFVPAPPGYPGEPLAPNAATITATVRISVPSVEPTLEPPALAHQHFVAASTQGALVKAYLHGHHKPLASVAENLASGARDCKKTATGRTCSIAVSLPRAGTYEFTIATYDAKPKHGHFPPAAKQLAAGVATLDLKKSRVVKIVLGGVVASTSVAAPTSSFPVIDPLSLPLTVEAFDADDNVIVTDTYVASDGKPVTITMTADSAASGTITFTPASSTRPPSSVSLTYAPAAMSGTQAQNGFATAIVATASNGGLAAGKTLTFTAPQLTFYTIPTGGSMPQFMTSGPDGALWFTEYNANQIARVSTAGSIQEFTATSSGAGPKKIIAGPDGNLWFTAQTSNTINRITTAGNVTSFTVPTSSSSPEGLTVGPDGNIWFVEFQTDKIGHVTTAGTSFAEFGLSSGARPYSITTGSDGAMWFVEEGSNHMGRSPTSGSPITSYTTGVVTIPAVMVKGADGALWFGGCDTYVGRMTTNGTLTTYPIPLNGEADDLTVGPDGAIWFSVSNVPTTPHSIGRISTGGVMTLYNVPGTNPYPTGIATGPDGAIWFVELNANQVGRLQ